MSEDSGYDLTPPEPKPEGPRKPRPGDPDFVPPVPVIIKEPEEAEEAAVDPDVEQNKAMAILVLCFLIPLVAAPKSPFAKYHANQGLLVFILWMIAVVASVFLYFGWAILAQLLANIWPLRVVFGCLFNLLPLALLMGALGATIFGIIQAVNGEKKGLPLIGHMMLIK